MAVALMHRDLGPQAADCVAHRHDAALLADAVVAALIDEVMLSPKPGLVDLRSRGAHHDLDWLLMCRSARALYATFEAMALAGAQDMSLPRLRERIGHLGRIGETRMMDATGGINTHRGAIWALGLLITAAARCGPGASAATVAGQAAVLARHPDRHAPAFTGNKGEWACRLYRVGGARGEAQAGFPHVVDLALPWLLLSRRHACTEDEARLNALMAVMMRLDDTCILARAGRCALGAVQSGAERVLQSGGVQSPAGRRALRRLEQELLARNLSPGGAADLLAATLLLDRLCVAQGAGPVRFDTHPIQEQAHGNHYV